MSEPFFVGGDTGMRLQVSDDARNGTQISIIVWPDTPASDRVPLAWIACNREDLWIFKKNNGQPVGISFGDSIVYMAWPELLRVADFLKLEIPAEAMAVKA